MRRRFPALVEIAFGLASGTGLSAALVGLALAINPHYFGYDDALNDMLPAYQSIFHMLSQGLPPILNSSIVSGGNQLVDIAHAPFHPLTLLAAATWAFGNIWIVEAVTGFLLFFGTYTGTYLTARAGVGLSRRDSLLAGVVVMTSPMMLGTYVTTWWAVGLGMVGFFWATGALMWAAHDPRPLRLALLGLSSAGLFLTGWPQSWLLFAMVCLLVANHSRMTSTATGWRRLAVGGQLAVAVVAGMLVGYPAFSEYLSLSSQNLIARFFSMANDDNGLVPAVSQLLAFANPVSGDFLVSYWGYAWLVIPVGFVSLLLLVAIFFVRHDRQLWLNDRMLQLLALSTAVFYAMTQLPSMHGPFHVTLRYLPYAQFFLILAALYYLSHTERKWSRVRFDLVALAAVVGALYSSWRVPMPAEDRWHSLVLPLLFVLATVALAWYYHAPQARRRLEVGFVVAGVVLSILQLPPATIYTDDTADLPDAAAMAQLAPHLQNGFLLDAQMTTETSDAHGNDWVTQGRSSRYALFGVRLVNGYEPVGLTAYRLTFPISTHGYLGPGTVNRLGKAPAPFAEACWLDLFRVTAILTDADPVKGGHQTLTSCGFVLDSTKGTTSLFVHGPRVGDGTYGSASANVQVSANHLVNDLHETVAVTNDSDQPGQIAFSRMAWPGYTATLNGVPLTVGSVDGVLVSVHIPAHSTGEVQLSFWPPSWRTALPVAGLGLLLLVGLPLGAGILRRRRQGEPAASESA